MTTTTTARIAVVTAGLGTPSSSRMLADLLSQQAVGALRADGTNAEVTTVELRDYAVDIATAMVSGYAPPRLETVIQEVVGADALIAVTPVFTASMSGLFKSFFDVIDNKALDGKPVLIGATGGSARHSMVLDFAMRPMFSYLRATLVPTGVFAGPEDWGGSGHRGTGDSGRNGALDTRVARAAGELAVILRPLDGTGAGGPNRPAGAVSAEDDAAGQHGTDPWRSLPFEELLARTRD